MLFRSREGREKAKGLHKSQTGEGGVTGGPGKGGATPRKCANCGEVGHIKTNKKCVNKLSEIPFSLLSFRSFFANNVLGYVLFLMARGNKTILSRMRMLRRRLLRLFLPLPPLLVRRLEIGSGLEDRVYGSISYRDGVMAVSWHYYSSALRSRWYETEMWYKYHLSNKRICAMMC